MTIWRMRISCWIPKATDTHPEYVIILLSHVISGHANASQCYVIRTLAVLLPVLYTIYLSVSVHRVKNFPVIMAVNITTPEIEASNELSATNRQRIRVQMKDTEGGVSLCSRP